MTDRDLDAEYRSLSPAARMSATNRPHVFFWIAAVECALFSALGAWMTTRSVAAGIVVIAVGIAASLFTAWPAHWSLAHPEQARRAVEIQRERRNRLARRHPAYFIVFVPILVAGTAALRFNRDRHHPSTVDWLVPAGIGLAVGLALGLVLIRRAHRSGPAS